MKHIVSFLLLATTSAAVYGSPRGAPQKKDDSQKTTHNASRGEQVFQAQCSRCHNAPEQLRPSISGTVVRHMRVRAHLTAADEKALREFLAP